MNYYRDLQEFFGLGLDFLDKEKVYSKVKITDTF